MEELAYTNRFVPVPRLDFRSWVGLPYFASRLSRCFFAQTPHSSTVRAAGARLLSGIVMPAGPGADDVSAWGTAPACRASASTSIKEEIAAPGEAAEGGERMLFAKLVVECNGEPNV